MLVRYVNKTFIYFNDQNRDCDVMAKPSNMAIVEKSDIDIVSIETKFSQKASNLGRSMALREYYQYIVSKRDTKDNICNHKKEKLIDEDVNIDTANSYQQLTFDDPTSYNGYVIDAWPPSKDKNISNYIADQFRILPSKVNFENKNLAIIVQSLPSEGDLRTMWRYFVGKHSNSCTSIIFLIGNESNLSSKRKLSEEISKYNDIALVNGFVEHYSNLTLKSMYSLKLFLNEVWNPNPPTYMLKVDIDVFVNIPKLFQEIIQNEKLKKLEKFIVGNCLGCGSDSMEPRIAPPSDYNEQREKRKQEITNNPYNKWLIPSYMYNKDTWPTYVRGPAYLLTRSSAECMLQKSMKIPYLTLEDVYTTGFLAQECEVPRIHHLGFRTVPMKFNYETNIINHLDYTNCFYYTGDIKKCSYDRLEDIEKTMMAYNKC